MASSGFSQPLLARSVGNQIVGGAPPLGIGSWVHYENPPGPGAPFPVPPQFKPFRNDLGRMDTVIAVIKEAPNRELRRGEWVCLVHDNTHHTQQGSMVYPKIETCPTGKYVKDWLEECRTSNKLIGSIASPDVICSGNEWKETHGYGPNATQYIGVILAGVTDVLITTDDIMDNTPDLDQQQGLRAASGRCITLGPVPAVSNSSTSRTMPVRALLY